MIPRLKPAVLLPCFGLIFLGPVGVSSQDVNTDNKIILSSVPFSVDLKGKQDDHVLYVIKDALNQTLSSGTIDPSQNQTVELTISKQDQLPLTIQMNENSILFQNPFVPGWASLAPPLIAISLALLFHEVITALLAGVWLGAFMMAGYNPFSALGRSIDSYVVPALGDTNGHAQIVVFSLMLGGLVGIVSENGGTQGIVNKLRPFAKNRRRGSLATWFAGLCIFFDDYANTLIVGTTMRPITDNLKISREKLAYIVDSTAAPVAALVPISTWVGYEISLIADGMRVASDIPEQGSQLALTLSTISPFSVFVSTIPYMFYPILTLAMVFLVSFMDRDFGPMAQAEKESAGKNIRLQESHPPISAGSTSEPEWYNAFVPIGTVILVVLLGLYTSGRSQAETGASLIDIFGAADPYDSLLWGSTAGCLVAVLITISQNLLTLKETMEAWVDGLKTMMTAMVILILAWSLGQVTNDLGTANYLSQILTDALPLQILPALVFCTAAAMAFATGTSWATMAILIPLVIPLTVSLGGGIGFGTGEYSVLTSAISSVLAGAIFGDHCSPISDTTVLSSTASRCDHVDHVRTQLPYALAVGTISIVVGNLGTAYGLPVWAALTIGIAVLIVILKLFGEPGPSQLSG
ncbi:MAG TPA: Na+/H+ antiporter NhaC family protein [Gemmatimonadetes bacterium]|nr:Na+/H+ antiporter NhaC family protein [Gemmatimonadota bacterium]